MKHLVFSVFFEIWTILVISGPFILFGFLMAGLLHTFIAPQKIVAFLGKRNWKSVIMASLCGVPLPLCSCAVLPMAATLREKGASRGATTSFLISTPEIGVDSIAITYGLMDITMTILRPLAAFLTALVTGISVNLWGGAEVKEEDSTLQSAPCCGCHNGEDSCQKKSDSSTISRFGIANSNAWWSKTLRYTFGELSDDLAHWLALGLILSGIIAACIPDTVFQGWAGQGISSLVLMLAISMPMYICASSSTPIAAVMIAKGLSPGAALVFLLAGPATNIGAIPVLIKILGKRSTILYLLCIGSVSLLIGYGVNLYYSTYSIVPNMTIEAESEEGFGMVGILCGLFLLLILIKGILLRPIPREWQAFHERFAHYTGVRLNWYFFLTVALIFMVVTILFP